MTDRAILLVDDDENLLPGLVRALREQPFTVYTARNGKEAIRLLEARKIDVIVADERMPGMSGVQLLTWVAENCADVVRIVLTAHAEAEMAIRAINNAGVFRFFAKPCNEARLAVTIQQALEQKAASEASRRSVEAQQRQLLELRKLGHDVSFQTHIAVRDLQRPIERILECCRRLEEQSGEEMDTSSHALLAEARRAAAEARRLVLQLQAAVAARTE
jgi:two-component system, probable response regulator PhcQ